MKHTYIILILTFFAPISVAEEKPNILFIFADDWGWGDLGCHGHPYVKTPNIDKLAAKGTDFQRFTVASGVCSPSRTAVMTGHFPARYKIDGHFAWVPSNAKRGMPDWLSLKAPSLPRMLQKAGYATAHFGKWHLSNNMIPDSPRPGKYGYDEYGAFNCSGEQMPVHEDAKNAIKFIKKSHAAKKPWFINLWVHEPHTPFHTLPEYRKRFSELDDADNIYASVLSHADDRIGAVLDCLDRLKIADNTLVIFSSDNGPARGSAAKKPGRMHDTARVQVSVLEQRKESLEVEKDTKARFSKVVSAFPLSLDGLEKYPQGRLMIARSFQRLIYYLPSVLSLGQNCPMDISRMELIKPPL